jgi:hypothetical protein
MKAGKRSAIEAVTKALAEEYAASGLYTANPSKADWSAIVTKVTSDMGLLRIPWAFAKAQGDMYGVWVQAYGAAKRRLAKGGTLVKAAPKPKARKRTPKAGTEPEPTVEASIPGLTKAQAASLAEFVAKLVAA